MAQHGASTESKERTAALLTDLWRRNKPLIEDRLEILERAGREPLTDELRVKARDIAHKLAGSLGMFGFTEGTEIARELELLLELPSPTSADIARLIKQLRSVLFAER